MYSNFTNTTAGELSSKMGIINSISPQDTISLTNFNNLDELRLTASQNKVQYLLDLVPTEKIGFTTFTPEENGFISMLYYNNGMVMSMINKDSSTVAIKRDDNSIRFGDTIDGHISILHAMLRVLFSTTAPNDTILGHAHNLFTTTLYALIISLFNREYSLIRLTEDYLACIRYACACISAAKHFQLTCSINDVAIPMTRLIFSRVAPSFYATDNNISTYEGFTTYLSEKVGILVDKPTFINAVIRRLQYRALVILECGLDFMIDCILSKTSTNILSRNLYKTIGMQQYVNLHNKIGAAFYQQVSLNIN